MCHSHVESIRQLIYQQFAELGFECITPPRETILIQNGHFCGRCFYLDEVNAIWFVEENEVKFYDADGVILKAITPANGSLEHLARVA